MRLKLFAIKAKEAENKALDHFIYLPNEKRFFFIDDVDFSEDEQTVILYFEERIDKNSGLIDTQYEVGANEFIYVVTEDNS